MELQPNRKSVETSYDAMVERLAADLRPVARIWPVTLRFSLWIALEIAILGIVAIFAPRIDLGAKLRHAQYVLELALWIAAGTAAAMLALRTAVPGRAAKAVELAPIGIVVIAAVSLVAREPVDFQLQEFVRAGLRCAGCVAMLAALPWIAMFLAVSRALPLRVAQSGALIGLAAFTFSLAATRLGCPINDSVHLLVWHVAPVAIGTAGSVAAALFFFSNRAGSQILSRKAS
jgi:hypothetical protein